MPRRISQEEWNHWYNKVYGYFYRRVSDKFQVEELTAETLTEFFLSEKEVDSEAGFVWKIARYNFIDYIRSKNSKKNQWQTYQDIENIEDDLRYNNYYLERVEALKKCLQRHLKVEDCQVVEMCVMYDFSSQETATELKISSENVRQKLSRSLKKVKDKCRSIWAGQEI